MSSKIPKAENFCNERLGFEEYRTDVPYFMIEFARLHVQKALKQASETFKMKLRDDVHELDMNDDWIEVDKNSILNAYPLDNIK